jgi:DNA adenine methylase
MPPTKRLLPPLKWHGGKYYLANKIVELMPKHTHYVEPYAGGLSVLLVKDPEGVSEVANDINGELANFWNVLRVEVDFGKFQRLCEATPFSEEVWQAIEQAPEPVSPIDRAWRFFVRCRQSLAGRMKCFATLSRTRTRRGMNEQASAWLTAIEGLPAVHERLKRVAILNRSALEVIRQQDAIDSLFYLDPPYLGETRATDDVYEHEMGVEEHGVLLSVVQECKGKVMLSGYPSDLYDSRLRNWNRHEFTLPNQAAGGKQKRLMTEVVWCNF